MKLSAAAKWIRERLWVGAVVGCVPWGVWLVSLALGGWYKDSNGQLVGGDHLAFYHAARLIRDGQAHRLYDYLALAQEDYQQKLIGWDYYGFNAYRNPPF